MTKFIVLISAIIFGIYAYYVDANLSATEKINLAYPLSNNLKLTEEKFRLARGEGVEAPEEFVAKYAAAKQVRALTCSLGVTVGRFDSIESVKSMPIDRECLQQQDEKLIDFIGLYQLSLVLSKPNLNVEYTSKKLKFLSKEGLRYIHGDVSYASGTGVFAGYRGDSYSVDLDTGRKIASMPTMQDANLRNMFISPNGRVTAIPSSAGDMRFMDNESGDYIFIARGVSRFYAWLPEVNAILVDTKDNLPKLIDLEKGQIVDYSSIAGRLRWVLSDKNHPGTVILGSHNNFSTVTHTRTSEGVQAELIKDYVIGDGTPGNIGSLRSGSGRPTLILNGDAILFVTNKNRLMLYNLKDSTAREFESEYLLPRPEPVRVNDHQVVLTMNSYVGGNHKTGSESILLNINDMSIYRLISPDPSKGAGIFGFNDEVGYMTYQNNNDWIGRQVESVLVGSVGGLIAERKIKELEVAEINKRRQQEYFELNKKSGSNIPAGDIRQGYRRSGNSYTDTGINKSRTTTAQDRMNNYYEEYTRQILNQSMPQKHRNLRTPQSATPAGDAYEPAPTAIGR